MPNLLAVRTGLEPATPCVTGTYSNQLNYHTILFKYGPSDDPLPFRDCKDMHISSICKYFLKFIRALSAIR